MSGDIAPAPAWAHEIGMAPLAYAEWQASVFIEVHEMVRDARALDPCSFPAYVVEVTPAALARRIIGALLDAGWQPAGGEVPGE